MTGVVIAVLRRVEEPEARLPAARVPASPGSNSRLPTRNVLGRSSTGESRSYSVGTDPLCRNGGVAHMPASGRGL